MQIAENIAENEKQAGIKAFTTVAALGRFSANCLNEEPARWIIDQLHPAGPRCPSCGKAFADERRVKRWYELKRIQCPDCGRFGTATTGTILHNSPFDARQIFLMAVLLELRLSSSTIALIIRCSVETVRLWKLKFVALNSGGDVWRIK